jgi:cobalt-precorrin 5A hydrolase
MTIAVITLSQRGAVVADHLLKGLAGARLYVHEEVEGDWKAEKFAHIVDVTADLFDQCSGLVYVAPCGVAVRAVAPNLKHKTLDPAVVVVDVGGRFSISLIGGHEGGANDLAVRVGNILAAEPVISTTTEAVKTLIVGVGCRRGTQARKIVDAVKETLKQAGLDSEPIRLLASADVKADEKGLLEAAVELGIPLRFVSSDEIRESVRNFQQSDFVETKVGLPAVAEPSALLAGRRTKLIVPKTTHNGVTVAVARESCLW